jgi:hypothetical protein
MRSLPEPLKPMRLITMFLIGLFAPISLAQTPATSLADWSNLHDLPVGTAVRVQAISDQPTQGILIRVTGDALVIRTKKGERTRSRTSVTSVSIQGKNRRARHALIGLAIGAGIGLAAGQLYDLSHPCKANEYYILTAPTGKVFLGPPGAIIGLLIGIALPGRAWLLAYEQ